MPNVELLHASFALQFSILSAAVFSNSSWHPDLTFKLKGAPAWRKRRSCCIGLGSVLCSRHKRLCWIKMDNTFSDVVAVLILPLVQKTLWFNWLHKHCKKIFAFPTHLQLLAFLQQLLPTPSRISADCRSQSEEGFSRPVIPYILPEWNYRLDSFASVGMFSWWRRDATVSAVSSSPLPSQLPPQLRPPKTRWRLSSRDEPSTRRCPARPKLTETTARPECTTVSPR